MKKIEPEKAVFVNSISGQEAELKVNSVVLVTDRISNDSLYLELKPAQKDGRLESLRVIGDAEAPGIIAQAIFSGHLAAREMDEMPADETPFKIERVKL